VPAAEITAAMHGAPESLTRLSPPFAAVAGDSRGVTMVADSMGFQHLFHSPPGAARMPLLSSSALVAGAVADAPLDETAVAVQAFLGWQLGQRTLFRDVTKLAPGTVARLDSHGVSVRGAQSRREHELDRHTAVLQAAGILRASVNALLDEHPDAVLQLTGGMDSRLLLSAIPTSRRKGLHAMTLEIPGAGDVALARALAARDGLRHDVRGLDDLADLPAYEAWQLCRAESTRVDAMCDPVALAAQRVAERGFAQGVRISGLGGEVARGFYYTGAVKDRTYTRADAARLAAWRMFVNDAVEPEMLEPGFLRWARDVAVGAVHDALTEAGAEWFRATDALYLRHRMQRWAGPTDMAGGVDRVILNPMLDPAFVDVAMRVRPHDKQNSRFLAELQVELDTELAGIPLEGRAAPAAYANPTSAQAWTQTLRTGRKAARKAVQILRRGVRAPAGGTVIAAKVVTHWRAHPHLLVDLSGGGVVSQAYLQRLLDEDVEPRPSSVAFLTNLIVASGADRQGEVGGIETSS